MADRNGIGAHQSRKMLKDEWLTPPWIIRDLGPFDLDPCAPVIRPWETAEKYYTIEDNGLLQQWDGYTWCNPPYGLEASRWLEMMSMHDNGIALIFARTDTNMFFKYAWETASAMLFIRGRLHFHHVSGERAEANSGAPSVLIAYGQYARMKLQASEIKGKFIQLKI